MTRRLSFFPSFLPSFLPSLFSPSSLLSRLSLLPFLLAPLPSLFHGFLPSCLPAFLPSRPSSFSVCLTCCSSFLASCLPCFLASFLSGRIFWFFLDPPVRRLQGAGFPLISLYMFIFCFFCSSLFAFLNPYLVF